MKPLLVSVPEEMRIALKVRAAEQKTTIKDLVTNAIRQELEKGGKEKN
jgi:hypothetical protein